VSVDRPDSRDREFAILNFENGMVRLRVRMTVVGTPYIIRERRLCAGGLWVTDRVFFDDGSPEECTCDHELVGAPVQWENPECPVHGLLCDRAD